MECQDLHSSGFSSLDVSTTKIPHTLLLNKVRVEGDTLRQKFKGEKHSSGQYDLSPGRILLE